ncbi:ribonuclease Z [candidate division KSB1 bacterium]|nr:ribonuclease Z [candidate division KSB1 bacterium]
MSDRLQLVFIGSGASLPNRRRLPCLAIERDGDWFLCDCGEGTQFHLARHSISPQKIGHIFISHLHGDHIFGLPGLLATLQMVERTEPLTLWGPVGLSAFLRCLKQTAFVAPSYPLSIKELTGDENAPQSAGPFALTARTLQHGIPCIGYRLQESEKTGRFDTDKAEKLGIPAGPMRKQLQNGRPITLENGRSIQPSELIGPPRPGRSIAYCTDTRPCVESRTLAQDCDVLIHDSTFSANQARLAQQTGHSTAVEAASLARDAGARRLILWHISCRHTPEQENRMLVDAQTVFPPTQMARDDHRITLERRQ